MDNELMRYSTGDKVAPFKDREVSKRAKKTYDDVRLKALQADGAMALGGHMMEGLVALRDKARTLSTGDAADEVLLAEIFGNTVRQCKNIQSGLFDSWGL